MMICATLDEARAVPDVVVIVAGNPIIAYQQGDAIPAGALVDPAAILADNTRYNAIDNSIATSTIGSVTPKTVAELKAMDVATYSAWFDANFTTAAQAIGLLKRLMLVIIRRVF